MEDRTTLEEVLAKRSDIALLMDFQNHKCKGTKKTPCLLCAEIERRHLKGKRPGKMIVDELTEKYGKISEAGQKALAKQKAIDTDEAYEQEQAWKEQEIFRAIDLLKKNGYEVSIKGPEME